MPSLPDPYRCAFAAAHRGDPMVGTAAPAVGMLLIEVPGGWGRRALVESRLDPAIGAALGARAVAAGLRVLLIRRPGRAHRPPRRAWAVVDCRPGTERSWWGDFGADEELRSLPLNGTAGKPSDRPTYLVCTHGRHDVCCALRGRPVAAALAVLRPEDTWECSHVGGDRFAANVVVLPHGLYYGRVEEQDLADLVETHEAGQVLPRLLRGRTGMLPPAQAAQDLARAELGVTDIDALPALATAHTGSGRWEVRLGHPDGDLVAQVRTATHGTAALLTCHARHEAHPPYFEVDDLRRAAG